MTERIAKQAKKIMDDFMAALEKAGKVDAEFKVHREQNIRDEKTKLQTNKDFSDRMMKNAPTTKDGCILAETLENLRFSAPRKSSISKEKKW